MAEEVNKFDFVMGKILDRMKGHVQADEAVKYSQSILNLAHAKGLVESKKTSRGSGS